MCPIQQSKCVQSNNQSVSNPTIKMCPLQQSKCVQSNNPNVSNPTIKVCPIQQLKCVQSNKQSVSNPTSKVCPIQQSKCVQSNNQNVSNPTIKVCPIQQSIHHSLTSWHRAGTDRRHGRYRGRRPERRLTLNSGVSNEVRATKRWSLHVAGAG